MRYPDTSPSWRLMRYNLGKLRFLHLLSSMDSHTMIAHQRKIYLGGVCLIILSGILFPIWIGRFYMEDFRINHSGNSGNRWDGNRASYAPEARQRSHTWVSGGMFGLDGTNDLVYNIAPIWKSPTKADASLRWPWQSVSQRMHVEIDLQRLLFWRSLGLIILGLFVGGFGWNYPKGNDNMVLLVSGPVTMGSNCRLDSGDFASDLQNGARVHRFAHHWHLSIPDTCRVGRWPSQQIVGVYSERCLVRRTCDCSDVASGRGVACR